MAIRARISRRVSAAILLAGTALLGANPLAAQQSAAAGILARDAFPIGSTDGALCQVQSILSDPAIAGMFDRVWAIYCRDAAEPVGHVLALRGSDAMARISARPGASLCAADGSCAPDASGMARTRHMLRQGETLIVADGIAAYDDALRIALESIAQNRTVPGTIRVATTSIGDANALARIQVSALPADQALAEGYRQNNSGDYSAAAVYFESLERRTDAGEAGIEPSEFTLNRALQMSNLGDFAEASRLFAEVDRVPTTDIVQLRLRRNFRAIHALNRRDTGGAIALLSRPLPAIQMGITAPDGAIAITRPLASGLNSGSGSIAQIADDTRLTPEERAMILDAQATQLRGTARRIAGDLVAARADFAQADAAALAVRDGRVTTIVRIRAQTMGEAALTEEAAGNAALAERILIDAITLLEREYPETMALAAARAKLAAFYARNGREEEALVRYRSVVALLIEQRRQLTGLYNQMAPYYRLLIDRQGRDAEASDELFAAFQLLVRPGVADTQAVLARELSGGSGEASSLFRQANTLARDLERARIDLARLSAAEPDPATAQLAEELRTRIGNLGNQQTATLARLADYPQYRAVTQDTLSLADLRATLQPHEAYVKMAVVGEDVHILFATQDVTRAWTAAVSRAELDAAVDMLRSTISVFEGGAYNTYPYDAETAHRLFTSLFGPAAREIAATRHLLFEPDGAMLRLPVNLLITDAASVAQYRARAEAPGGDPFDMRGTAWLGRNAQVSTVVSALSFRNTRGAPASRAARAYIGLGNNTPVGDPARVSGVRAADPNLASGCAWGLDEWNRPIAPAELFAARQLAGGDSSVITGDAFTDRQLRERGDLSSYRIIHFATHGLVTPPRPNCPTRPALLTSFDSQDSDGLLSFDEIFDMRIDADLVILSACDTAGQASVSATRAAGVTTGGGSALDGLVRAFIGAGGRSVLASHWPAPDDFDATQRLITGLFTAAPGTSVAEAMGRAQITLMDNADTSHPYYWAGFAIVGDGERPMLPAVQSAEGSAAVAASGSNVTAM
jgi:CHAT domain-containing protein